MFAQGLNSFIQEGFMMTKVSKFPAVFNVSSLNGANGFVIQNFGGGNDAYGGSSVSGLGDINGDGVSDVMIGAPNGGDGFNGASYVVFGSKEPFSAVIDAGSLNGTNGFMIEHFLPGGYNWGASGGESVSGVGDVNGDGISDMLIGAQQALNGYGACYVVFGSKIPFSYVFNASALDGTNGFVIDNLSNNFNTRHLTVNGAGDINGDGFADIIIGAPFALSGSKSYVVFGNSGPFSATFNASSLDGKNGFTIVGYQDTQSIYGQSVDGAGDVNGDGIDDVIIGAADYSSSYVIFGNKNFSSVFNISSLNGKNGFTINGDQFDNINIGNSVSGIGDINGDGFADIMTDECVVFGRRDFPAVFSVDAINGTNGFIISGIDCSNTCSLNGIGDINGDKLSDIIISQMLSSSGDNTAYVILGSKQFNTTLNTSSLDGSNGFAIDGFSHAQSLSVSRAGDLNNDGLSDILVGSANALDYNGEGYVIFGI